MPGTVEIILKARQDTVGGRSVYAFRQAGRLAMRPCAASRLAAQSSAFSGIV